MTFYTLTDSAITFRTFLIMIRTLWPKALLQPGSSLAWTTKVRLFSKRTPTQNDSICLYELKHIK